MKKIRKAVFPVAGLGTRLLPATKVIPKEMLAIIDKPLIQYAVEEAQAAGIEQFIFITGRGKRLIKDYFSAEPTHNDRLRARALAELNLANPKAGTTMFARQQSPRGLGHAVWCARDLIGDEPFAVLLVDRVTRGEPGCLSQIVETFYATGGNVVSIEECTRDQSSKYGIVAPGEKISNDIFRIITVVEKPLPEAAPSNSFISGRYVLQPEIFKHLSRHDVGVGGEIQLTDALVRLAGAQPLFGHRFRGRSFDCGSKEGLIAANVAFALDSAELAPVVLREIDSFRLRPHSENLSTPNNAANGVPGKVGG